MDVVRVIGGRVKTLGVAGCDIGFVNGRGPDVRLGSVVVTADTPVDVSGHVHEVSGAGDKIRQCVGRLFSSVRARRSFYRVNVQVNGKRVRGRALKYGLEDAQHFFG